MQERLYVFVTHYVEMTFWCSSEGRGIQDTYVSAWVCPTSAESKVSECTLGEGRASPLLPHQQEPVCFPTVESFWEVKIWFD